MAALNLNEQRFIRELARELGKTEVAVETALQAAMVNTGYRSLVIGLDRGGLVVETKAEDMSRPERPYGQGTDFTGALSRLGR